MNHVVWLVWDSARHDAVAAARTPNLDALGATHQRYSYASWTAPSHLSFLMGVLPHANQRHRFASAAYREDALGWRRRLSLPDLAGEVFLPRLSLPAALRRLGYRCEAYVSLPVLNGSTLLSAHFDRYTLMDHHNDAAGMVDRVVFGPEPTFLFLNCGETHYPYLLPGETEADLPHITGLHGAWRDLRTFLERPAEEIERFWAPDALRGLWEKQVTCVEYLDHQLGRLFEKAPPNTWFVVASDHGELFGEDGLFGHGPVFHPKVFEVFVCEGLRP